MEPGSPSQTFASPFDVPPNFRAQTNFSPVVDRAFRGIVISAPSPSSFAEGESVDRFGSFANIPVSVTFQLEGEVIERIGRVTDHIGVIAVSRRTNRSYSSTLASHDPVAPRASAPSPPRNPAVGLPRVRSHLTFNLAQYLDLPHEPDTYWVHLILEQYQSNVLSIELVPR